MTTASSMEVDVLMASDLRFPGGTTASMVEETLAQSRAGYRTGLLHMPSPIQRATVPFAPRIRDLVESGAAVLAVGRRVRAKLLVIRHPSVLTAPPWWLPQVQVDHVVIVANQVPVDPRARASYYDVVACHNTARRMFGVEPVWAPIGPHVRAALEPYGAEVPIREADWTNIIDVDAWYRPRVGGVTGRPVIGRHSRGHWSKWPADRRTLLAAYPDDPGYVVKVLGGTEAPRDILGGLPANWVDLPFNSMPPAEFLQSIDFLVYYHHPDLIEAFGRTVLEGVASGAVAIVDPQFAATFGEACRYAPVGQVREVLDELSGDLPGYLEQSRRGVAHVRERFSYQAHTARIAQLIGPAEQGAAEHRDRESLTTVRPDTTSSRAADESTVSGRTAVLDLARRSEYGADVRAAVLGAPQPEGDASVVALLTAEDASTAWQTKLLVETVPTVADELPHAERVQYLRMRLRGLMAVYGDIDRIIVLGDTALLDGVVDAEVEVWAVEQADGPRIGGSGGEWAVPGLPKHWRVRRVTPPAARPRSMRRRAFRSPSAMVHRAANVVRQRAPRWVVELALTGKNALRGSRRWGLDRLAPDGALLIVDGGRPRLPVPASAVSAGRPTAVFVVTNEALDPETATRMVAERALLSNAFRPVLLAPSQWIATASAYGLAIETALPQGRWPEEYTENWQTYLRSRLAEVVQVFQPAVAVTLTPDAQDPSRPAPEALEVAEALGMQRTT